MTDQERILQLELEVARLKEFAELTGSILRDFQAYLQNQDRINEMRNNQIALLQSMICSDSSKNDTPS